jgi:hypothetical protein
VALVQGVTERCTHTYFWQDSTNKNKKNPYQLMTGNVICELALKECLMVLGHILAVLCKMFSVTSVVTDA